jgi:phage terminase small subunit
MSFTKKQRVFIEEYLQCWNASEAARRAGYSKRTANRIASNLLSKIDIQAEIQKRIDEKAMSADEVLLRLGDMARGDLGDFMDIQSMSFHLSLKKAKELGLTHLIKKVKQRTTIRQKKDGDEEEEHWIELEIHDPQAALDKLARIRGLYKDTLDVTSKGERLGETNQAIYDRAFSTLTDAIGKEVSGENGGSNGSMAATE